MASESNPRKKKQPNTKNNHKIGMRYFRILSLISSVYVVPIVLMSSNTLARKIDSRNSAEQTVYKRFLTDLEARQEILTRIINNSSDCTSKCRCSSLPGGDCYLYHFVDHNTSLIDERSATDFLLEVRNRSAGKTKSEYNRHLVRAVVDTIILGKDTSKQRLEHVWAAQSGDKQLILCRESWAWLHGFTLNSVKDTTKAWRMHTPGQEINIDTSYVFSDTTYHSYSFDTAAKIFNENGLAFGNTHFVACIILCRFYHDPSRPDTFHSCMHRYCNVV